MHEISLVQGLLAQLAELAQEHDSSSVKKVRVEVGPFSGIVIDSFQFGFEVLAPENTLTRNAQLEIITPPKHFKCFQCSHIVVADMPPDACSQCGNTVVVPDGGDGLILLQVEME